MTKEIIQVRLANVASILVLLSDAPMNEVASKLPEIIAGLKELQSDAESTDELQPGQMRIA